MSFTDAFTDAFTGGAAPAVAPACDPWPISWCCDEPSDAVVRNSIHEAAQLVVWAALGRRHGVCTLTERPDLRVCGCEGARWRPYLIDGRFFNLRCDPCGVDCCSLRLSARHPVELVSVSVDGTPMDVDRVFLRGRDLILRDGCWPTRDWCDENTVEVEYRAGEPVPPGVGAAVGEVACELVAACSGKACKLPSRAISITRQGVTVDMGSPEMWADSHLWGLPVLDSFVRVLNPNGLSVPSRVLSPDYR